MKFLKYAFLFTMIFTSCKTTKNMINSKAIAKEMSARKVARKHIAANFDRKTIDAKLKVNFDNEKTNQSLSVSMKIIKDEVIWLRGTKIITLFKAEITPTSVRYYSSVFKNYFEGDFSMIEELLGVKINFEQLQNLFLGQSLLNIKEEKQNVEIVSNSYVLSPEKQTDLYDIFFNINPSHFKLDQQSVVNSDKNVRLDIKYPSYKLIDNEVFPSQIHIRAKNPKRVTAIDFIYKTVIFDTDVKMPFSIPRGYKQLKF
ncbi:DUF4292 domain-containing protein [Polaribacter litorisediminis]|uniref:DUF4292 domain-containing protein n=1 Tax=Polaribacter litorisediminis TaxID=1908341 RepID=UPI001CBAA23B|nr:DUF4292 domain-containing protein [Polaribacter litorisediminis]